jgi:two-component system, cell cycle sensor histidine kinase and response regulator CckA
VLEACRRRRLGVAGLTGASLTAEEHFHIAVNEAPIGIIRIDGAKGRYVFANETFARMIGRPLAEVLESDPYTISVEATHPEDRELGRDAMARMAQGEMDRYRYEKRLMRRNGEVFWASVEMAVTRDAQGRLAFLTLYFTNIHEQRLAEETRERLAADLRQAQKLEALGRLAGGIAHDFNNRLVIILGYTELLKRDLPPGNPLAAHTDMVLESAQRASDLTRQLLAYSRRQVLKPRVFDLNNCVDRMRKLLERLIGDNIELITKLAAKHPIFSDPGHIEQVVLNLALNARDAMSRGGQLVLETHDASLRDGERRALPAGDYVTLVVSDTGSGIAQDVLPRIFEPFFTTKDPGRGTGLGLATVEGIVHQSGGCIEVESSLGWGTRFTIYLPRGQDQVPAAPVRAPSPKTAATHFETVLICDDDDGVRQLMVNVLHLRAYKVLEARDGHHALQIAAEHRGPIHLLVTDLVMPKLGGVELAAELRKRRPELCVLYVSGYTDNPMLLSGTLEPGTDFLPKPFLPGELTNAVSSILERGHD